MELRRFAVCLAISLSIAFASIAVYLITSERNRRKKNEGDYDDPETLNFSFLRDAQSIEFIMNSKVMLIMRGLPGSGKSVVARHIKQVYGDLAVICSADNFRLNDQGEYVWKIEEYETTHLKCREKAVQACKDGIPVVVIDNTNIDKRLLYRYITTAHSAGYFVVLVEPRTRWKYNITELTLKNHHNVTEDILRELLSKFQQIIAVYYGWFPSEEKSTSLKDCMLQVLSDCLVKIPSFKDHLVKENRRDEHGFSTTLANTTEVNLLSLYMFCLENQLNHLHVTSFYNKRGLAQQSSDYLSLPAVQEALGSVTTLTVIAWTITPRAVTARVKLNPSQLKLWGNLDSGVLGEGSQHESTTCASETLDSVLILPVSYTNLAIKPTIGVGDTAHVTLSLRSDMSPVQGQSDMGELVRLELANQCYLEYAVTEGVARDYGDGRWAVYLNEPIHVDALFTGFYGS